MLSLWLRFGFRCLSFVCFVHQFVLCFVFFRFYFWLEPLSDCSAFGYSFSDLLCLQKYLFCCIVCALLRLSLCCVGGSADPWIRGPVGLGSVDAPGHKLGPLGASWGLLGSLRASWELRSGFLGFCPSTEKCSRNAFVNVKVMIWARISPRSPQQNSPHACRGNLILERTRLIDQPGLT